MGGNHLNCCVQNCTNNGKINKNVCFYSFPTACHKLKQRQLWLAALKKTNDDGSPWKPERHHKICSAHFVGNMKSVNQFSPSYTPTIFPNDIHRTKKLNEEQAINRFNRAMKRKMKSMENETSSKLNKNYDETNNVDVIENNDQDIAIASKELEVKISNQYCQVDFLSNKNEFSRTFICNRYVMNNVCDAEIQTEISINEKTIIKSRRTFSDKCCGISKTFKNKLVGPDSQNHILLDRKNKCFSGMSSIKNEEQLQELTGVSFATFNLLLKLMPPSQNINEVIQENRLLIFLCKMKLGLTYSALSVLFSVDRRTISRIFITIVQHFSSVLRKFVVWPNKLVIQSLMPNCFKPKYKDCRVIIDCTEIRIQMPSSVKNRVLTYSHYKKGFTFKILVGCSPDGLITFISKCFGGRTSDSQITIKSGILDLLENGDLVLADKGFPGIKSTIDESGKNVLLVMPPVLDKPEFTKKETEETYSIGSVRIHVERIMQRLRIYKILDKFPTNLFPYCDDIVFVCCTLVNLQAPIISRESKRTV